MFHSIKARLHSQVCPIGCCLLQNGYQLHYHAADSVLTSRCSFTSQQIWIKIIIALAILGICIKFEILSAGKSPLYIHISGWHTFGFRYVSSHNITGWHRGHSGQTWHCFRGLLSELPCWRCTHPFATPACLGILCCAIVARKAAICLIFPKHSRVSFHRSLHISIPWILTSRLLLFSDICPRFLDQLLHFLYCGAWKPSFGPFARIQGKAHVRLFERYPTSLHCNSCRHVENLWEMSCCI